MKSAISCLAAIMLAGCAHPLTLYPVGGGQAGTGSADEFGKRVTINLNGRVYTGTYVHDGGQLIPTSVYGSASTYSGTYSGGTAYGASVGTTYVPGSGNGRILAAAPDGGTIRCDFQYRSGSGIGQCEDNAGKRYDLKVE